jgi:flagellar biogenesis protein FliO
MQTRPARDRGSGPKWGGIVGAIVAAILLILLLMWIF